MKDDRNLPLESIRERYSKERNMVVAKLDSLSESEMKSRILAVDSSFVCASQEPLHFVVVSLEFDETFNVSIKSVDYDGDSEASLDDSESEFDESFSVGRNRLSSFHSVEEFSDDETTMGADAHFNQNNPKLNVFPKENFTPIFHHRDVKNESNMFFDECSRDSIPLADACGNEDNNNLFVKVLGERGTFNQQHPSLETGLEKDLPSCSSIAPVNDHRIKRINSCDNRGKSRVLKRKYKIPSLRSAPIGKRTRSNSLHK